MSDGMDDLKEAFLIEAGELLVEAENCLLAIEKGDALATHYNVIFRALHSIKGGAGMLQMTVVQDILHEAESKFQTFKDATKISSEDLTYFLKAIDNTNRALNGQAIETAPAPVQAKKVAEAIKEIPLGKPLRAAVIDDEPVLVETLSLMLQDEKFEVKEFSDPKVAVQEIPDFDPDIVLCDMKMPGMTGLDVLTKLNSGKKRYPVIFISGYLDKDVLIEAINQGSEGVIEKPFDTEYVVKLAIRSARKARLASLFEQTLNLLLYQYSDFDDYLKASGKDVVRNIIETEMKTLMDQRRLLRELSKKS